MTILYLTKTQDKSYPSKDIEKALLNLGHKVKVFDEDEFPMKVLSESLKMCDMFLFHTGGIKTEGTLDFQLSATRLQQLLDNFKGKKVFWFLHKIWGLNDDWMDEVEPFTTTGFATDETFLRRLKECKIYPLHDGTPTFPEGEFKEDLKCELAFAGKVYGLRQEFANSLKQQYGNKFKVVADLWNKDFADLCQSAKVMVVPKYPFTDYYWGDAIYRILSAGGFLIHPRWEGLKDEGFIEGEHFIGYSNQEELQFALKNFLTPEAEESRKVIAKAGQKFARDNFSYEKRLKYLIRKTNEI